MLIHIHKVRLMKTINKCTLIILSTVFIYTIGLTTKAYCADKTPENLVHDFYTWYISDLLQGKRGVPAQDDTIYSYVYPCTVNKCRKLYDTAQVDADYFIQGQDYWAEMLQDLTVGRAVQINDSISIVPVSFDKGAPRLIVFVQKEKGSLYITKVERVPPLYP